MEASRASNVDMRIHELWNERPLYGRRPSGKTRACERHSPDLLARAVAFNSGRRSAFQRCNHLGADIINAADAFDAVIGRSRFRLLLGPLLVVVDQRRGLLVVD